MALRVEESWFYALWVHYRTWGFCPRTTRITTPRTAGRRSSSWRDTRCRPRSSASCSGRTRGASTAASPSWRSGSASSGTSRRSCPGSARLGAQEAADQLRHHGRLLEMRGVAGVLDRLHAGARDLAHEVLGVDGRHQAILGAPDQKRGRLHAMDALLEALVGNGPDEFPRGAHGPGEADLRGDTRLLVLRLGEHGARGGARGIAEHVPGQVLRVEHHPVGDGGVVAPEAERMAEGGAAGAARAGRGHAAGDKRAGGT